MAFVCRVQGWRLTRLVGDSMSVWFWWVNCYKRTREIETEAETETREGDESLVFASSVISKSKNRISLELIETERNTSVNWVNRKIPNTITNSSNTREQHQLIANISQRTELPDKRTNEKEKNGTLDWRSTWTHTGKGFNDMPSVALILAPLYNLVILWVWDKYLTAICFQHLTVIVTLCHTNVTWQCNGVTFFNSVTFKYRILITINLYWEDTVLVRVVLYKCTKVR